MALDGEQAEPRIPAPAELRPVLGFSRLSAAAYAVVQRVIDDDGIFRARVAEAADEEVVGRAGWLWLHRPVGWADDEALHDAPVPAPTGRRDAKDPSSRHRKAAADAEAARRRTAEQLAATKRAEAEHRSVRADLERQVEALAAERSAALRSAKALEAELAAARRDLKVARAATRQAEAELLALRSSAASAVPPAASAPVVVAAPEPAEQPIDRAAAQASLRVAAQAAEDLAGALAELAEGFAGGSAPVPVPTRTEAGLAKKGKADTKGSAKPKKKGRSSSRSAPTLPPGIFDGTVEAHRHLITSAANLVVVDGYNVARAAWSGLDPEEERRRTVALLDDVQARSGGQVVVVFDGDTAVTAPKASRNVRVRFSQTGETADDAIAELVAAIPASQPVVVVSSDRAVAADARRLGAVAIGARAFLSASGR